MMSDLFQQIKAADSTPLGLVADELGHVIVVARHPIREGFGGILMIEHVQDRGLFPEGPLNTQHFNIYPARSQQVRKSLMNIR